MLSEMRYIGVFESCVSNNIQLQRYLMLLMIKDARIPPRCHVIKFHRAAFNEDTDMPRHPHHERDMPLLEKIYDVFGTSETAVKDQNQDVGF